MDFLRAESPDVKAPRYSWAHAPVSTAISNEHKFWNLSGKTVIRRRCAFSALFVTIINLMGIVTRVSVESGPRTNGDFWLHVHVGLALFSFVFSVVMTATRGRSSVVVVLSVLTIWFSITFGIFLLMTMAVSLAATH
ncbi:unnamed protein product, partial [Mesorhabditis belari]|uniref:Cytochrome b561 domain-containing protein n=1 Tax=Mesorhabditis belari TaxID=2138241 RepID=A0AAF3F6J8_9BILA